MGLQGARFHDLRHTFATLMLLAGVHPKIVSEMLGHSSVAFTLDVYSHVVGGWQKAAMKRLDEMLKPEMTENQDVGKMSADDGETYGASGRIRTDDQRFTKLPAIIPNHHFTFKLEPLCQLPNACFVREIPTGVNPFHSVY